MVIIHDEVENEMNKLVTLSEIRREKKESSLSGNINSKDELLSNTEEYFNFKNQFCKDYFARKTNNEEYSKKNTINLINADSLNEAINKIFLLNNKKPFIDFVNEIFGDCLGTNCEVNYVYDDKSIVFIKNGILKNPSYDIKISVKDDYRLFEYNIQFQTDDYENIAITISKNNIRSKVINVINLEQKKRQYRINDTKKDRLSNRSDLYLIMVNSNIRVPDSYEVKEECNGSSISYKFNIFKGWKYDFKDLYEKNLYLLFPLKIFDLKKCISYMKNSGYSEDLIKKETSRFFNEMNKYLNMVKEKTSIDDTDVSEFNIISKQILGSFYN